MRPAVLFALLLTAACGGGGGGGGANDPSVLCSGADTRFAGFVYYQDRPYDLNGFGNPVLRPVRYASVAMIDAVSGNLLGSTTTDVNGAYCVDVDANLYPASAFLKVRSEAKPPQAIGGAVVTVSPNGQNGNPYVVSTDPIGVDDRVVNRVPNFVIDGKTLMPSGPFAGVPVVGAFNIMDVVTYGYQAIGTAWGVSLPELEVAWYPTAATGTFYRHGTPSVPGEVVINISGAGGGESDEFDDDTILHEFGHFVYDQVGFSDSPGGMHFINGYKEDARLAYSEGWASFLSAMMRDALPVAASNRTGPEWMISPYPGTSGNQGALSWAYEMENATAVVADQNKPDYDTAPVGKGVFQYRVKTTTSEVSVSAALWDMYRGIDGAEGVGTAGILDALLAMSVPNSPQTFGAFWEWLENYYNADAAKVAALRAHLIADRKMGLADDEFGADDTVAELDATVAASGSNHLIQGVDEVRRTEMPATGQFTLYPSGDVDLYRFVVDVRGTYGMVTYGLSNGADTQLELLDEFGNGVALDALGNVVPANDNYETLTYHYWWTRQNGELRDGYWTVGQDYSNCGPIVITVEPGQTVVLPGCPDNPANYPRQDPQFIVTEYLASRIEAELDVGTYILRVTRPSLAPPSSDIHGSYRLCVEKVDLLNGYVHCPRNVTPPPPPA